MLKHALTISLVLSLAAFAHTGHAQTTETLPLSSTPDPSTALPALTDTEAEQEGQALSEKLLSTVPRTFLPRSEREADLWTAAAKNQLSLAGISIDRPQILTVVNRNPRIQEIALILAYPDSPDWTILGVTHVSTGSVGRKTHYITPTGVFPNDTSRLGYRALGTLNENGIRGIGRKGMRVWDFGWQTAKKGWKGNGDYGEIRLEMHATDPDKLEQRIGRPDSEGCIRIPTAFNTFMDKNGIIDAEYEKASATDIRFAALLPKQRTPTPIAGSYLVVTDFL